MSSRPRRAAAQAKYTEDDGQNQNVQILVIMIYVGAQFSGAL